MDREICDNCEFIAELRHNFKPGAGFKKDYCCVVKAARSAGKRGYAVQVSPWDSCEVFTRRTDRAK